MRQAGRPPASGQAAGPAQGLPTLPLAVAGRPVERVGEMAPPHPHDKPETGFPFAVANLKTHLRSLGFEPCHPAPPHITSAAVAEAWVSFDREVGSVAARHIGAGAPVRWLELDGRCQGAACIIEAYAALADLDAIRQVVEALRQHARQKKREGKPLPPPRDLTGAEE